MCCVSHLTNWFVFRTKVLNVVNLYRNSRCFNLKNLFILCTENSQMYLSAFLSFLTEILLPGASLQIGFVKQNSFIISGQVISWTYFHVVLVDFSSVVFALPIMCFTVQSEGWFWMLYKLSRHRHIFYLTVLSLSQLLLPGKLLRFYAVFFIIFPIVFAQAISTLLRM